MYRHPPAGRNNAGWGGAALPPLTAGSELARFWRARAREALSSPAAPGTAAAGRRTPSNEGTAKAARIVGIIGTVLWGIGIIVGTALTIGGSLDFPFTT